MRSVNVFVVSAVLAAFACVLEAEAFGLLPRSAQCSSLEALGRLAQAKMARGYQPTQHQLEDARKRQEWYEKNCKLVQR